MSAPLRVVYYVNQFFAGLGGEAQAGVGPAVRPGALGPGLHLQQLLAPAAEVVATAFCGDTYFADQPEAATAALLDAIRSFAPDVVVLGPAFNAGRYGLACARLGAALARDLGIPAITGMHAENPGLDLCRAAWAGEGTPPPLWAVQTDADARGMRAALERMAALARAAAAGSLPPAREGGYFPRGVRRNVHVAEPAAARAVALLVRKLRGEPFATELAPPGGERVPPAPPVRALAQATVALITDGGLVPRGNPDGLPPGDALRYAVLDVGDRDRLDAAAYEAYHRGYDTTLASADPNRLVPLDAARDLERAGRIGRLLPYVYTTAGCSAPVANARRIGRAIAVDLQRQGVDAAIVTST
jgi:betaine reductase